MGDANFGDQGRFIHNFRNSEDLGLPADRVLFVAGSGFDLFGTASVGMTTLWHNRVGLAAPNGAPAPAVQSRTLRPMVDDFLSAQEPRT